MSNEWVVRHFGLCNPEGPTGTDLPLLLRRLAAEIEEQGIQPMDIQDLVIHSEITPDGPWWQATLYWSPDSTDA